MDDKANFLETCRALTVLGIDESKQDQIFRILAGILHLGNIIIEDNNGDSSVIDVSFNGWRRDRDSFF